MPATGKPVGSAAPLVSIARIAGGGLLILSSIIHLVLMSGSDLTRLSRLLLALAGLSALLLGIGVTSSGSRWIVLPGALLLAITSIVQIAGAVSGRGYHERLSQPLRGLSPWVHVAGFLLLAAVLWLTLRPASGTKRGKKQASLAPGPDPRTAQLIRWPAERPHPVTIGRGSSAKPEPAAAAIPTDVPLRWTSQLALETIVSTPPQPSPRAAAAAASPVAEAVDSAPPAADAPAKPRRKPKKAPVAEIKPAEETVVVAAPPPAPEASARAAAPEPVPAAGEPAAVEPAAAAVEPAEPDPALEMVPLSIPEPYYHQLLHEQEVLKRLQVAFGRDDPRALNNRSVMAFYYVAAGDYGRGADIQKSVSDDSARIHGADHPHTVTARDKYDQWRKLAKKQRRAKASVG